MLQCLQQWHPISNVMAWLTWNLILLLQKHCSMIRIFLWPLSIASCLGKTGSTFKYLSSMHSSREIMIQLKYRALSKGNYSLRQWHCYCPCLMGVRMQNMWAMQMVVHDSNGKWDHMIIDSDRCIPGMFYCIFLCSPMFHCNGDYHDKHQQWRRNTRMKTA